MGQFPILPVLVIHIIRFSRLSRPPLSRLLRTRKQERGVAAPLQYIEHYNQQSRLFVDLAHACIAYLNAACKALVLSSLSVRVSLRVGKLDHGLN